MNSQRADMSRSNSAELGRSGVDHRVSYGRPGTMPDSGRGANRSACVGILVSRVDNTAGQLHARNALPGDETARIPKCSAIECVSEPDPMRRAKAVRQLSDT